MSAVYLSHFVFTGDEDERRVEAAQALLSIESSPATLASSFKGHHHRFLAMPTAASVAVTTPVSYIHHSTPGNSAFLTPLLIDNSTFLAPLLAVTMPHWLHYLLLTLYFHPKPTQPSILKAQYNNE